jgi:hypothetical protein
MDQSLYLVPVARVCRVRMQATRIPCNSSLRQQEPTTTTAMKPTHIRQCCCTCTKDIDSQQPFTHLTSQLRPIKLYTYEPVNHTFFLRIVASSNTTIDALSPLRATASSLRVDDIAVALATLPVSPVPHHDTNHQKHQTIAQNGCERALLRRRNQDEPIK